DAVVVDVELIPGEAVASADGVGVVVVVPAFAAGQESDPPVVAGVVLGLKAGSAPEVRRGVDQPRCMQAKRDAEERSPQHHADCTGDVMTRGSQRRAKRDLQKPGDGQGKPVILRQPYMNAVAGKVRSVAAKQRCLRVQSATGEN